MSRNDDVRFCGLYNLIEVKATGRIGLYIGGVLAPSDKGGDWLEVRFEDGTHWPWRTNPGFLGGRALVNPGKVELVIDLPHYHAPLFNRG